MTLAYKKIMAAHPLGYFGKWQFIYKSNKGEISLIQLPDYHRVGEHLYEIYCLDEMKKWKSPTGEDMETPTSIAKGKLTDIERFKSREDATKHIIEILRTDK